tara:strand:+ start:37 stop:483 length:447 start_codon:yes stop_codon:yes gene_type:complete
MENVINLEYLLGGALRRGSMAEQTLEKIVDPILDEQKVEKQIKRLKFMKSIGISFESLTCVFFILFVYFMFRKMDQNSYKKQFSNLFKKPEITEINYEQKNKKRIQLEKEMESVHVSFIVFFILTIVFGIIGTVITKYTKDSLKKLKK